MPTELSRLADALDAERDIALDNAERRDDAEASVVARVLRLVANAARESADERSVA